MAPRKPNLETEMDKLAKIAALTPEQQELYREARELGGTIEEAISYALFSARVLDYHDRVSRGDFHEPNGDLK